METRTRNILQNITKELEQRINSLISICESPIEEYFLINICDFFYSQSLMSLKFEFLVRWVEDPYNQKGNKVEQFNYQERGINVFGYIYGIQVINHDMVYQIIPQFQHGSYRLDFAVIIETPKLKLQFCIECDGHEFHRTKQQILKDSERVRKLAEDGWTTLRYTGSELFKWQNEDAANLELILTKFLQRLN